MSLFSYDLGEDLCESCDRRDDNLIETAIGTFGARFCQACHDAHMAEVYEFNHTWAGRWYNFKHRYLWFLTMWKGM